MQISETSHVAASILVVEDAREVLSVLERTLADSGFTVFTAVDGEAGLQLALDRRPDLVILDIGLPKLDGYDVARELRARGFTNPVLMLTARGTISDKVEGFDAGADDYLAKPFSYDELLARVKALLRRSALRTDLAMIRVGDLTIDPFSRDVRRGTREITLTQKEYSLLEYLARHAGMAMTRESISQAVWKQEFDPTTNIVDVYINYLRKKVDQEGDSQLLHTVRGVGYVLKPEG
jgi:two-component system, OmpR family, response regulator MprA